MIKVKKVITTGKQWDADCGVAEDIIVKEIVYGMRETFEEMFSDLNHTQRLILSYHDKDIPLFHYYKKDPKLEEETQKFFDQLNVDEMLEFVAFVDMLPRRSDLFKKMTSLHLCAKRTPLKNYAKFYGRLVYDNEFTPQLMYLSNHYIERGFRSFTEEQLERLVKLAKKQQPKKKKGKKK
jgi:hypothetical protein